MDRKLVEISDIILTLEGEIKKSDVKLSFNKLYIARKRGEFQGIYNNIKVIETEIDELKIELEKVNDSMIQRKLSLSKTNITEN